MASTVSDDRGAASNAPPSRRAGLPLAHDAISILGQSLLFAGSIGCLFGVIAVLARLL